MVEIWKQYWEGIIIGIVLFIMILFLTKPYNINSVEYDENNYVVNRTDQEYFTDIVHIGLNKLGIKETAILIREDVHPIGIHPDIQIKAYINGNGDQFIIHTNISNKVEAVSVLAHELIHLEQYYEGRLIDTGKFIYFDDKAYMVGALPFYFKRPWELEGFDRQVELAKYIREILFTRDTPTIIKLE